jgi:hypothetical protein
MRSIARRLALVSATALLAVTGGIMTAGAASAGSTLTVTYKITGSTTIKSVDATTDLGPGKLVTKVNLTNGSLTANLTLPPANIVFKEFGVVPVTATAAFVQDGKTTGQLNPQTGAVATKSKIIIKLTALSIAGYAIPVPATCQSATPAVIKLASQKGFSVVKGGNVAGTYTIPPVAGCGALTPLLNLIFPGPGNTILLTLGAAKVG